MINGNPTGSALVIPSTGNTSLWLALWCPHLRANANWENSFLNTLFKGINPLLLPTSLFWSTVWIHSPLLLCLLIRFFTDSSMSHRVGTQGPDSLTSSRCTVSSSSTEKEISQSLAQGHMPTFPALRRVKAKGLPQVWGQLGHHSTSQWDLSQIKKKEIWLFLILLLSYMAALLISITGTRWMLRFS